jgi:hypothetical protein
MSTSLPALDSLLPPLSKNQPRITLRSATEPFGRILLMSIFLLAGPRKICAYAATAGTQPPSAFRGLRVIAFELLGSLAINLGWRTRVVSLQMAAFMLAAGRAVPQRLLRSDVIGHVAKKTAPSPLRLYCSR